MKYGLEKVAVGYGRRAAVGARKAKRAASAFASSDIGSNLITAVGAGTLLGGISSVEKYLSKKVDHSKFANVISYAKQKHPELRNTQDKQMEEWMKAFYALAPSISTNKELGSSMLLMAKNYGGNIDMATAKMIADAGAKSGGSGHGEAMISFMTSGRSMAKGK